MAGPAATVNAPGAAISAGRSCTPVNCAGRAGRAGWPRTAGSWYPLPYERRRRSGPAADRTALRPADRLPRRRHRPARLRHRPAAAAADRRGLPAGPVAGPHGTDHRTAVLVVLLDAVRLRPALGAGLRPDRAAADSAGRPGRLGHLLHA